MMKRTLLMLLFLTNSVILFAEDKLSLGLGWPYVGLKYNLSQRISSELRYATGEGINVYAGRLYWNFYKPNNLDIFTGLEGGNIAFDTLDIKGTGYEGSVFIGGEYFISKRLSLMMDFEPVFISLKSDDLGVDGIEWVTNFAIYFHFGKTGKEVPKAVNKNIKKTDNEEDKKTPVVQQQINEQKCIIIGMVTDIEKTPIPGAVVKLIKDNKEILLLNTSKGGVYKIAGVIPGNYVMGFWKTGYNGITKPFVVEKTGKPVEFNITLEKIK